MVSFTTDPEHSWKIFQRDTEAGRLLSRLYGCSPSQTKISYPKQRRRRVTSNEKQTEKTEKAAARAWKTTYTVHTLSKSEEEEKENERRNNISRALSMKIPKVGRQSTTQKNTIDVAEVDLIPRRKTESGCRTNLDQVKFLNKKYRPPAAHAFSSDAEKQRLNDLFSGGKGECLPENLASNNSAERPRTGSSCKQLPTCLFDQVYQEIKERRAHQLEMEKLGAGEATRQSTVNEIQSRLNQLRKIDPERAAVVIKLLMK